MLETIEAHLYDFPRYYDLVYGSDWKAEFDFLQACFAKYAKRKVKRLFEPACGTGRLMFRLAKAGYDVAGNDLNPKAIAYCNERLKRHGFPETAEVGDMSDFTVRKKFDAAFNMINSFRHLPSEKAANAHLRCMTDAVAKGGLYVLGIHLTPTIGPRVDREEWVGRRGNLAVISTLWSEAIDTKKRNERVGMTFDVYTPTRQFRIADEMDYRTYTAGQIQNLLKRFPEWEVAAIHDFCYEMETTVELGPETEDVVFVLRKR